MGYLTLTWVILVLVGVLSHAAHASTLRGANEGDYAVGRRLLGKQEKKNPKGNASPPPSSAPSSSPLPTGVIPLQLNGGCPDAQALLNSTNAYRAAHGARALQWDTALAADSQAYAQVLAAQACTLHHADQSALPAASRFGENLYMAGGYPNVTYTCNGAIDSWYGEVASYKFTAAPYLDNIYGGAAVVGHFTQLVWNSTSTVGCGFATGSMQFGAGMGACKVVVCRYRPPGNVAGTTLAASNTYYLKNVFPKL